MLFDLLTTVLWEVSQREFVLAHCSYFLLGERIHTLTQSRRRGAIHHRMLLNQLNVLVAQDAGVQEMTH
jgi:hypothetical protein